MDNTKAEIVELDRPKHSVGDLTRQCNDAASKMSMLNPHRLLLLNCAYAMQQLVQRLDFYEGTKQ